MRKPVKVCQRDRHTTGQKSLRDVDAPLGWDTTLPPLRAGVILCAEFGGDLVNNIPGERAFEHERHFGRTVQDCQDDMSNDGWTDRPYDRRVPNDNEEARFNEALIARVHRLREDKGWTAAQMATALGIPAERYRKYEYRTPLPHYLIERFALIVDRDVDFILLGKTATPRLQAYESRRKSA